MSSDLIEYAKASAAKRAVAENFNPHSSYVGIGSGTTVVHVVNAIKDISTNPDIRFIPTGSQSRKVITDAGLTPVAFDDLPEDVILDVAFDGADECDEELNCVKGGGACLFQEKIVVERAKKFVCVADYRKAQPRLLLGTAWKKGIPIEVAPIAAKNVLIALRKLGATDASIRLDDAGSPAKTDQDFWLIDAIFPPLLMAKDVRGSGGDGKDGKWEVEKLARKINSITGVLEVGLFYGPDGPTRMASEGMGGQKPVAVYFGNEDGSVSVRTKDSSK